MVESSQWPSASIVIPAANEQQVVGRCLRSLLGGAEPGEFEVVVVCNGCRDRTADVARTFGDDVTVVETAVASKPGALNLGDSTATAFPRVYMDADVELSSDGVRHLIAPLQHGDADAAAPALELETAHASRPLRAYHRIWVQLPQIRQGLMGRGVYAVSARGRARFAQFPDLVGDDLFIDSLYAPSERAVAHGCVSRVRTAPTLRDEIRRKARVFAGNRQLIDGGYVAQRPGVRVQRLLELLRTDPRLVTALPVYVLSNLEAKRRARSALNRGEVGWDRSGRARA